MKMKATSYPILMAMLMLAACSSGVNISSQYEDDINFSEYSTFRMLPVQHEGSDRFEYSDANQQLVKNAIISELESMNFSQDESNPDVLIHTTVGIEQKAQMRERTLQDGAYYMGQRNYSWSASDSILVGYYDEGSLIVNMIDADKNQVVWHSTAQKALKNKPADDWEDRVRQAVADMFAKYPGNPNASTSMK
jgi:hypothetical protein